MKNKIMSLTIISVLALALIVSLLGTQSGFKPVLAAAPTPVVYANNSGLVNPAVVAFLNVRRLTADTKSCVDLKNYSKLDTQYVIDQGTVNTVTLTLLYSNVSIAGPYVTGPAIVTANAADASTVMLQLPMFGRYGCVFADLTNANPITITTIAVAK